MTPEDDAIVEEGRSMAHRDEPCIKRHHTELHCLLWIGGKTKEYLKKPCFFFFVGEGTEGGRKGGREGADKKEQHTHTHTHAKHSLKRNISRAGSCRTLP